MSPNALDAGRFSCVQNTTNLDLTRDDDGVLNGFNVAFDAEHREEDYWIRAGEARSQVDDDGPGGGNPGSQVRPGRQPGDVTDRSCDTNSAYIDLKADPTDRFMMAVTGRYADDIDAGNTIIGKFALHQPAGRCCTFLLQRCGRQDAGPRSHAAARRRLEVQKAQHLPRREVRQDSGDPRRHAGVAGRL